MGKGSVTGIEFYEISLACSWEKDKAMQKSSGGALFNAVGAA